MPAIALHWHRLFAFTLLTASCVLIGLHLGKDLHWDQLNYHLYLGFSALHGRLSQDFLPASIQSYFVPHAYVPLAAMIQWRWSDASIVASLSALGALAVYGAWELGGRLCARAECTSFSLAGAWLASLSSIGSTLVLGQVGSSFIDLTTSAPVLLGFAALATDRPTRARSHIAVSAILLAAAAVLKLTNILYALAAIFPVLSLGRSVSERIQHLALFGCFGALTAALLGGPWWWGIWQAFDNPVFPYFNGIFESPLFPHYNLDSRRFAATTIGAVSMWPFHVALPQRLIWLEANSPDMRFMLLGILALIGVALPMVHGRAANRPPRALVAFSMSFVVAWAAWISTSGNGRYFMPFVLALGPLLVGWIFALLKERRHRASALALLALAQYVALEASGPARWNPGPWHGEWLPLDLPRPIVDQPALFVSIEMRSGSFLAQRVHPDSSFVHAGGQHLMTEGSPAYARLKALAQQHQGRVFTLHQIDRSEQDGSPALPGSDEINRGLARLGWSTQVNECLTIRIHGLPSSAVQLAVDENGSGRIHSQRFEYSHLLACPVVEDIEALARYRAGAASTAGVFGAIEARCGELVGSEQAETGGSDGSWLRFYNRSDLFIGIDGGRVWMQRMGQESPSFLGSPEAVVAGEARFRCTPGGPPGLTQGD